MPIEILQQRRPPSLAMQYAQTACTWQDNCACRIVEQFRTQCTFRQYIYIYQQDWYISKQIVIVQSEK